GAPTEEAGPFSRAGRVGLAELPLAWTAYDGVRALVVNPQTMDASGRTAEPRAQEAVRAWVRSGGRLVVLAEGPGEAWRQWLPEEVRGAVEIEPPQDGPVPESIGEVIRKAGASTAARRTEQ